MGRRQHRSDSADQTTYRKPDQRSVSVVVRKGAKDSAVAYKEAGQAAQDNAADKSHHHGENKIGPLAFHGHQVANHFTMMEGNDRRVFRIFGPVKPSVKRREGGTIRELKVIRPIWFWLRQVRISGFGFPSGFEFRVSNFPRPYRLIRSKGMF
jgi:hypothetical protein